MNKSYGISTALSGTYSFTDHLPQLKTDGIDYIEIALEESFENEKKLYKNFLPRTAESGLKIWSVHIPFGESVNPAQTNENKRRLCVENIKRFVELTYNSGAKTFVIHGSAEPVLNQNREKALYSAIKSLNELNTFMKQQGLTLALENLPRSCIGNSIDEMKKITSALPDLKLCFDCNHFTTIKPNELLLPIQRKFPKLRKKLNAVTDSAETYAAEFADKIVTVHISDYDGINERHWMPGQGIIDFKYISSVLNNSGFNAPILFEPNPVCRGIVTTGKELITRYEQAIKQKA